MIYAGALDQQFYALDARTGDTLWTFQDTPTNRANWSAPAVADGAVYAGNRTGYMYALEAKTGKQIWKFKAGAPPASDPLLAEGVLYFGVGSHGNLSPEQDRRNVYALNARTGVLRWRLELQGKVYNGPALDAQHVYYLTAAGLLYALH